MPGSWRLVPGAVGFGTALGTCERSGEGSEEGSEGSRSEEKSEKTGSRHALVLNYLNLATFTSQLGSSVEGCATLEVAGDNLFWKLGVY